MASRSTQGASTLHPRCYDAALCSELDRKYICPVCLSALHEPMQTSCGHRFCRSCILGVINGRPHAKCPVDNVVFKCSTEEHESQCLYISVPCDNGCGVSLPRHALTEHEETCERRHVNCQHCNLHIPFTDLTKHQVLACQNLPVQCTLCGQTGICRKDISAHIDITIGDCPLIVVPCQYASFGCQFQDKRRDMIDHYREAANHHILLLVRNVSDQEQRISALERQLEQIHLEQEVQKQRINAVSE
ncbi:TNF receptor-associated factor 6-B-like isoform X2 [Ostrea edulis]|uniref:TNF receptor-associated factor 6-B-like isoform X2 n=1 Tax=Ostrea edulis TaxID=37623 RepID=UPI0024AF248C|nr:TNF receptor-associated factor 6-B-like isoform X2 [Ostrea edulis]